MIENTHNAKRRGRQFSTFMSENIYALVDLFDKAVTEGVRPNTENEVGTLRRDIDRWTDVRQTDSHQTFQQDFSLLGS